MVVVGANRQHLSIPGLSCNMWDIVPASRFKVNAA